MGHFENLKQTQAYIKQFVNQFQGAVDFIYKDPLKIVEARLQTPDLKDEQRENKRDKKEEKISSEIRDRNWIPELIKC